jgi:hypothetical protein
MALARDTEKRIAHGIGNQSGRRHVALEIGVGHQRLLAHARDEPRRGGEIPAKVDLPEAGQLEHRWPELLAALVSISSRRSSGMLASR